MDGNNDFQGIVGYSSNISAFVIGFRGSSNIPNWINDFTVLKEKVYEAYPEALVHQGFYQLYQQVAEQVVHHVQEIHNEHANAVILVTGHSLGGVIAMICAFELALLHGLDVEALHTFGQPRVGNYAFAKAVEDLMPKLYRVIHKQDIVVHFPPTNFAFRHSGIEVWYDEKFNTYRICSSTTGENKYCSIRCGFGKCISFNDHYNYLNVEMGKLVQC